MGLSFKTDIPENAIEVAQTGFRKANSILCPFALLLLPRINDAEKRIQPDNLPKEELVGSVPCWAFDVHVREGNQAIGRFLRTNCETVTWLAHHVRPYDRFRVLGKRMLGHSKDSTVTDRYYINPQEEALRKAVLELPEPEGEGEE